ncbi:probable carboxylesterase 8 [Brachypodium distachyon]|uniref:Alpha/beta hydrolase fold-3 domain-containing protein n=1 Tax=Brachypodium distachyon TaxID=15368 RepID=I1I989_BRADI|nr:probable carboxylesterase 8 [Brachypodium distachyon]KQJ99273.1 hypothetical protein BRADI_3g42207v3 [Brachypodium distachyon]|eukprot:XP_010235382.1 probable carboxylesterase 8 [Brachypodium distachyon]
MSTTHADATAAATDVVTDARAPPPSKSDSLFMQIVVHPDGTVTRPFVPTVPPSSDADEPAAVQSRDVPLDAALGTYLRLYLPPTVRASKKKLPVILYLHGGGFVLFTPATVFYHASCEAMAAAVPAIVASLHYRLAPDHRLPAAYHDAAAALLWLRQNSATDPWISAHADLESPRCFLMGSSSGANIAFHAALKSSPSAVVFPVSGVVMHQPYLGGETRTASEAASEGDAMLPLEASDKLWRLALPDGADRDHVYSNPAKSMAAEDLAGFPRCLVSGSVGDPLIDRQRAFAAWLRGSGAVEVVEKTDGKGFHAAELFVPEVAEELFAAVRDFVYGDGDQAAEMVVVGDDEPAPVSVGGAALT